MRGWAGTGEESADEVRVGMNARWRFASSSGTSGGTRAPGTEADPARLTEHSCLMLAAAVVFMHGAPYQSPEVRDVDYGGVLNALTAIGARLVRIAAGGRRRLHLGTLGRLGDGGDHDRRGKAGRRLGVVVVTPRTAIPAGPAR